MSNRLLLYMTGLVIVGMGILFALNLAQIFSGTAELQSYLKYNDVRGMAIKHHGLLYTLNFQQQNDVIGMLNESVKINEIRPTGQRKAPDFEELVIYQFEGKPDLHVTPITYINSELVYAVPEWNRNGYLMDVSAGRFKRLLSQTYD